MDELPASRSTNVAVVGEAALDPTINQAIRSAISKSIGSLTGNLTQVVESSLTQIFSDANDATVEQAVKKARRENNICNRKENQQQLDHELQVLEKLMILLRWL